MTPAKKSHLTPTLVRLMLTLSLFFIAGATVAGFILGEKQLNAQSTEVSHTKVDASGSKASLQTLQAIEKELTANQDVVEKAKNIKHTSALPQFKAIEDIRNHAQANDLTISAVTFASSDSATSGAAPAAAATPAAPSGAAEPLATTTTAQVEGIEITFTLGDSVGDGSVEVVDFVNFLYDIEHSIPKMQVQGISLTGKSETRITVEPMKIKMFINKTGS